MSSFHFKSKLFVRWVVQHFHGVSDDLYDFRNCFGVTVAVVSTGLFWQHPKLLKAKKDMIYIYIVFCFFFGRQSCFLCSIYCWNAAPRMIFLLFCRSVTLIMVDRFIQFGDMTWHLRTTHESFRYIYESPTNSCES